LIDIKKIIIFCTVQKRQYSWFIYNILKSQDSEMALFVVYLQYPELWIFVVYLQLWRFSTQIWKTHVIVSKISSFYFKNIKKTFFRVFDTFLGCSSFFISAITVGYLCTPLVFLQNIEKTFFQYKIFWYILKKLLSFAQYQKGNIRGLFPIF
jgi:hypothetical protein